MFRSPTRQSHQHHPNVVAKVVDLRGLEIDPAIWTGLPRKRRSVVTLFSTGCAGIRDREGADIVAEMSFDPSALDAYQRAAARVSDLLGTAATETTTAAGVDLSGLGVLGREFAAAWTQAAGDHASTLSTAGNLVTAYQDILNRFGASVTGIDTGLAGDLRAAEGEVA